jgi:hypothetical protein
MPPQNNNANASSLTGIAPSAMSSGYFQGAPLTKLGGMLFVLSQFVLKSAAAGKKGNNAASSSFGQVVMAAMFLTPLLRKLERESGSAKFFSWMFTTMAASIGLLQLFQILIGGYYWQELFAGVDDAHNNNNGFDASWYSSYHHIWVGAVLYWYVRYVPRLYPRFVSIAGIPLSEKALYGFWGLYVVFSGGLWSVFTSLLGAASSAGVLSTGNLISLPDFLADNRTLDSLGGLFLLDPPTKIYAPLMMATMNNANNNAVRRNNNNNNNNNTARAPLRRAPAPPPPQAAIDQLTAMGFGDAQVRQALQQSGNNIERAADRLLTG